MKAGLVGLCLAAVLGGGAALYLGRHHMICSDLEEEFLNSTSEARSLTAISSAIAGGAEKKDLIALREQQMLRAKVALNSVYAQCGSTAGQTAFRKAVMPVQP